MNETKESLDQLLVNIDAIRVNRALRVAVDGLLAITYLHKEATPTALQIIRSIREELDAEVDLDAL